MRDRLRFALRPLTIRTDAEHAAITALIRRAIEQDKFPRPPRLDPLR